MTNRPGRRPSNKGDGTNKTRVTWDEESMINNPPTAPKKLPHRVYKRGTQGTLVYSPDIAIYVYTADHGILDLGPYMTSFQINRAVNDVSTFSCTFDNKYSRYDRVLRRMDRVAVFLKRVEWVQVFAGYVTIAPWETVVPGDAQLEAQCTIKRLKHTYWDPSAPAAWELFPALNAEGSWRPDKEDGGAAMSMYKILTTIANWDSNQIKIQSIPESWVQKAAELINLTNEEEYNDIETGSELKTVKDALHKLMSSNGWIPEEIGAADAFLSPGQQADGDGRRAAGESNPANADSSAPTDRETEWRKSHKLGKLNAKAITETEYTITDDAPASLSGQPVILRKDAAAALEAVIKAGGGTDISQNIAVAYLPKTTLNNLTQGGVPRPDPEEIEARKRRALEAGI